MDRNLNIKLSSEESKYQKELLHFKNDLLKDFKKIESNLNEKYSDSINDLKLRLKDYDNKFDNVNKKIMELSNTISNDNTIKDNINKLNEFKEKTKKKILEDEIQLNQTYNELHKAIIKYDKLLSDSVLYPGIIGNLFKFKNFHEFILYNK